MVTAFASDFLWGAATSAYQIEGAAAADGRGPSIWDVFAHTPGKMVGNATGDVACDHYHRFKEDVSLMRKLNLGSYRFSISWPRVLAEWRGRVNQAGLDFYDRLVDALRTAGIEPFVTLYHWDLPAALQMELGGWLHPDMPVIFADYAELLFDRLGDRVRYWLTLNEPWCVVHGGFFNGAQPPGVRNLAWGYQAGHNLMRAHAYAVDRYRTSRNGSGSISLALNFEYSHPASDAKEDHNAAQRAMEAFVGWFGDPAHFGDYPAVMRERLGELLPPFEAEDTRLLLGSMDFIALNYYTSNLVRHAASAVQMETEKVAQPEQRRTAMDWPIVPDGLRRALHWLAKRYPGLPIYITENGACFDDSVSDNGFVDDQNRIDYLREHLATVKAAVAEGVDVHGYYVWSLLDNLEWSCGFSKRFGLVRCDFDNLRRTIKGSGRWYARWIGGDEQLPDHGRNAR